MVEIPIPLVPMWDPFFNFIMFFYFHFHLFNFLFSGFSQRYLRRWYIRRLLQDKITGTGTQFRNQKREKIVHFFLSQGAVAVGGWSLFIMCILAYGTSIPF